MCLLLRPRVQLTFNQLSITGINRRDIFLAIALCLPHSRDCTAWIILSLEFTRSLAIFDLICSHDPVMWVGGWLSGGLERQSLKWILLYVHYKFQQALGISVKNTLHIVTTICSSECFSRFCQNWVWEIGVGVYWGNEVSGGGCPRLPQRLRMSANAPLCYWG